MFGPHFADPNDHDALHNLRSRSQIVENRRERDAKQVEFEQFLTEIIQPQEALQKIMELSSDSVNSPMTLGEHGGCVKPAIGRIQEILSDQSA